MKKRIFKSVLVVLLVSVSILTLQASASPKKKENKPYFFRGNVDYKVETIIEGEWGEKKDQFGRYQYINNYCPIIKLDTKGNIVTFDYKNTRIKKYNKDGKLISSVNFPKINGIPQYHPKHIAIDSKDNIYVADRSVPFDIHIMRVLQ